jgi:hypothetical protein
VRGTVPGHDIVGDGRRRYAGWRVGLHALQQLVDALGGTTGTRKPWWRTLKSRINRRRAAVDMAALNDDPGWRM